MSRMTKTLFFSTVVTIGISLVGCGVDVADPGQPSPEAVETMSHELTVTCTPGEEKCDIGCYYDGGPSTDDCIIKCNAAGNGWITLENCGWAQNFPYSASCLNSQPHPVCQWN
ncbi:hypothetical protein DAT35_48725 [Vitiosangium sp. GDMCC 1.1324]|nr:hypothetical protein DAT35_48725 [Vitiosangium sp. GDMCC 1.1324]